MEIAKPEPQHQWLKKFLGNWTYEHEASCGPDQPPMKSSGRETVRAVGDLWIVGESSGQMPGGAPATMLITLGYDPARQKFVGTWIGSMMPMLWVYDGVLEGNKLSLHAHGPSMTGSGTADYIDAVEFLSDDHRTLTSSMKGDDGKWTTFMTAHYRRTK